MHDPIFDEAEVVKSPDWSETRNWHVRSASGEILVVVTPAYRVLKRTGWSYYLKAVGPMGNPGPYTNRLQAAAQGLDAWTRVQKGK